MKHRYYFLFVLLIVFFSACKTFHSSQKNSLATPSDRQLQWQQLEYYAFIHFNMNTFTDMEWGMGDENPAWFNPTQLDARQWARVCKEAGMKGIIITAKHHDGFCLWPSKYTEHSVKNATWKDGKGDVLKELAQACKEYGLKFGVYLSPWDRNHAEYGKPAYVRYFHQQLEELLTNYGPIFEVWFDGANGGSGYYGGANETRKIEASVYYEWDKVQQIVRKWQPQAVIFGGTGQDIRWVGNENGQGSSTNWSTIQENNPEKMKKKQLAQGDRAGKYWMPAEVDVSIRPGWYYHAREDHQVHSLEKLVDIYYHSVGKNAALLLNIPVDKRGLIHTNDSLKLMQLKRVIDADFAENLFAEKQLFTQDFSKKKGKQSYWFSKGLTGDLLFSFDTLTSLNRCVLKEFLPLGQRVDSFQLWAKLNNQWQIVANETTIGYQRILRFPTITTDSLLIKITHALQPPAIAEIGFYHAPALLVAPTVSRSKEGKITLSTLDKALSIFYTVDGSQPSRSSHKYQAPFSPEKTPFMLKVVAYDSLTQQYSEVSTTYQDIPKRTWTVVAENMPAKRALNMIDNNPASWAYFPKGKLPQTVVLDLGHIYPLHAFTYLPSQDRWAFGTISHYALELSEDGVNWHKVSEGEFGNIKNHPIEQVVSFPQQSARWIRFTALKLVDDSNAASFAEIGVRTTMP